MRKTITITKRINNEVYLFTMKKYRSTYDCRLYRGKKIQDRECACATKRTKAEALKFKDACFEWVETGEF